MQFHSLLIALAAASTIFAVAIPKSYTELMTEESAQPTFKEPYTQEQTSKVCKAPRSITLDPSSCCSGKFIPVLVQVVLCFYACSLTFRDWALRAVLARNSDILSMAAVVNVKLTKFLKLDLFIYYSLSLLKPHIE
ncbi:uncharacterized protein LY89DRAFT_151528 [Mollisia scopiformis]|uniref:Uncharacterized protein n=1 Tax=Mollisia scopiformis TaxID=149040 RepID=A0A194X1A0_MOLSC|nr:uncharacterized protein LY89DRAFT_151528 [Mollisia scopiformis]KUJ13970.1 hypothetical protein LY89DRAFT_151528 [Mollisia scopiformis]